MENSRNNSFLSLQHLEKIYPNGEKAVHDFNLEIKRNEFVVIVGPSGCGKSTTLRMVAGLEDITAGDIYLEGELLTYKPSKDRKMAMVFQSYALYPQMNVYDNIAFPLTINKYPAPVVHKAIAAEYELNQLFSRVSYATMAACFESVKGEKGKRAAERGGAMLNISFDSAKELFSMHAASADDGEAAVSRWKEIISQKAESERAALAEKNIRTNERGCEVDEQGNETLKDRRMTGYEIKTKVYETAEKLDLLPYLDKLPKELSGGQMQRVALGRAIIKNVPIFMMDEPLSNLDAKLRLSMRSEIVQLHNRINATTIYVTHDQTEAMTMATRIVVMSRGFIQQIGSPKEIYNEPVNLFVAKFIGSPPMNIFPMRFDRENNTLSFGAFEIKTDQDFTQKYDAFYANKIEEFREMYENFDQAASEKILKLLSVTGEYSDNRKKRQSGGAVRKMVQRLKKLFHRGGKEPINAFSFEKNVCAEKYKKLQEYMGEEHNLIAGIRPERVKIQKVSDGKPAENCVCMKPVFCELLGSEYNVYFELGGQKMIGQLDAKQPITVDDDIYVSFSMEDIYLFDAITGERFG